MNIKKAKEEIKNMVKTYLHKDEFGEYKIPATNQRPILLIGPPGIGKTAIMEQIAQECGIGLVSYTITHHTRQSAIGLPFITPRIYNGREYSTTEYTMSEIVASVYNTIEETGIEEGILFIDEINCVSETLAAPMLQFLKEKAFGNHKIPKGFLIVAAGNPPEYNKSAREFDIVTLDRLRQVHITPDYSVWKEYAYKQGVHEGIITYLDIKKEHFYSIETTVDGVEFVTARGWEDLSKILYLYEELSIQVEDNFIVQYLQSKRIAKDFHNYYDFYQKYKKRYSIDSILEGNFTQEEYVHIAQAPFDERLTVIGLILSKLYGIFTSLYERDLYISQLYDSLKRIKENLLAPDFTGSADEVIDNEINRTNSILNKRKAASHLDRKKEVSFHKTVEALYGYKARIRESESAVYEDAFAKIKEGFEEEIQKRLTLIKKSEDALHYGFIFMEEVFGESQEMVIFITELTMNYYSSKFIGEYGSEEYYKYNKEIMFNQQHKKLINEIDSLTENW